MSSEILRRDGNRRTVIAGIDGDSVTPSTADIIMVRIDPTTKRLLVDATVTAGFGSQDGITDGEVVDAGTLGVLVLGTDGSNYQALSTDSSGRLKLGDSSTTEIGTIHSSSEDIFENTVIGKRDNQIQVNFFSDDPGNLVTVTSSGSGGATRSGGQALFATGATASSSIKGVSLVPVRYLGHEVFAMFTAAFTSPIATATQRVGLFSTTDGFFVGYENLVFGITHRFNSSDTNIAQANFNLDTLTGATGSKFTAGGTPVALDPTKNNVYRVRFGWLGSAPIIFEVLSPDGRWVKFHQIYYPNTLNTPSLTTPNLPMTVEVVKTAGATDIIVRTACWVAGVTSDLERLDTALADSTLAALTRSVITGVTTGGGGGYVNVKVAPSGALTVAATMNDGTDDVSILAAGADGVANTENELVSAAMIYGFNGTTFDRIRGDLTNGLLVNLGTNNDVVVSATDLDIRNLTSASDSVEVKQATGTNLHAVIDSGSVLVTSGLGLPAFDYVSVAYPDTVTETYTFKTGGSGGSTVATVTVVYTDATKASLSTVTKV